MQAQRAEGTKDLIGRDMRAWQKMQDVAAEVFGPFGFEAVETPAIEQLDVFVHGIGQSTDVVRKEMFRVFSGANFERVLQEGTDAKLKAKQRLALRPEGTAGVVRAVVENNLVPQGAAPVKLYYAEAMFRGERPQKGRLRQFHQVGIEWLGAPDPAADAECIIMLMRFYEIGGGRIAYYLAKQLVEAGLDVKIIESDPARCEELSVLLPKAEILCGDGTNEAFLRKCGIETTGAVAALTGIDEENVLIGMYIRKTWPKVKVITKVNRTSFQSIIDSMDLGSVFNPRNSASNLICRYVRTMQNSGSSSQIETLYKLVGGKAEALEFRVSEGSKLCGIPLQELKLRENLLIGCIGRGGQIIIPSGQDTIEPGDSVIVVTCSAGLGKLEDILARGPGHE